MNMDQPDTTNDQVTPADTLDSPDLASQSADLERESTPPAAGPDDQLAVLRAKLAELEDKLRTTEVALVTRIADVDDDRRDSATRLQRAYHSMRDELASRLARQRSLMLMLSVFVLLLIGCLAIVGYLGFDSMRRSILQEIAPLETAFAGLRSSEQAHQSQTTRDKLSQLSAAVESISTTVERLGSEPEAHPAQTSQPASSQPPAPGKPREVDQPSAPAAAPPASPTPPASPPSQPQQPEEQEAPAAVPAESRAEPEQQPAPAAAAAAVPPSAPQATATAFEVGDTPFSIQLMGFYSLDELQRFVHRYALPPQVYYREETYQGRPWYVLIHSLHPTQESANASVTSLPSALSGLSIWIRKLDADDKVTPLQTHAPD